MADTEFKDHPSMPYEGSQVFQAGSTRFRIPSLLLETHGGVFRDMVELCKGPSDPIVVQDSEEAFEAFFDAITRPLQSCLFAPYLDLEKVLYVLSLAHKYCITSVEAHARSVAIVLTRPDVIWNSLSSTLTAERVLQIGSETNTEALAEAAVDAIVSPRRSETEPPPQYSMHLPDLADRFCAPWPYLAARLYYIVACKGSNVWGRDPQLSVAQKVTLGIGSASCVHAMAERLSNLRNFTHPGHRCGGPYNLNTTRPACLNTFISQTLSRLAESECSACDVLGRLAEVLRMWGPSVGAPSPGPCQVEFRNFIEMQLVYDRAQLAEYFQLIPEQLIPEATQTEP